MSRSLAGVDGCRNGWVVVIARLVEGRFVEPQMNGGLPLAHRKTTAAGAMARIRLLEAHGLAVVLETAATMIGNDAKLDDVVDAIAALWTARRYAEGKATVIPEVRDVDAKGLRMEMWR